MWRIAVDRSASGNTIPTPTRYSGSLGFTSSSAFQSIRGCTISCTLAAECGRMPARAHQLFRLTESAALVYEFGPIGVAEGRFAQTCAQRIPRPAQERLIGSMFGSNMVFKNAIKH